MQVNVGLIAGGGAGVGTVALAAAGGAITFVGVVDPAGGAVPIAVVLSANGAGLIGTGAEPQGIYANLGDPLHFGVNRATGQPGQALAVW